MANLGNTTRPAYVYDAETDTWLPIGVGAHSHDYTTQFIGKTLVDAKGDIVTASANDVPAILSKGADGTILVSDSSTSTGLAWQPYGAIQSAGKNKIINGDMTIAQRGTSFTPASNVAVYPVDRWTAMCTFSAGTFTASQQVFTPGTAPVSGYEGQYYLRAVAPSSGTNPYLEIAQKIENVRTLAGQTVTLSFWAKSNVNTTISGNPILRQTFGTGGSSYSDATIISGSGTLILTTNWQRFSFTYSLPSVSGKTIDINSALIIYLTQYIAGGMSAGFTWDIWGVQLEAGSIATPFTTATGTIQGELAACQRYYYRINAEHTYGILCSVGYANSTSQWYGRAQHPIPMRIAPSSMEYGGTFRLTDGPGGYTTSVIVLGGVSNKYYTEIAASSSGMTQYRTVYLQGSNDANSYIAFNAEL